MSNKKNNKAAKVTLAVLAAAGGVYAASEHGQQVLAELGIRAYDIRDMVMPTPVLTGDMEAGVFVGDVKVSYDFTGRPLRLDVLPVVTSSMTGYDVTFDAHNDGDGVIVTGLHLHFRQSEGTSLNVVEDEFNLVLLQGVEEGAVTVPFIVSFEQAETAYDFNDTTAPVIEVISESHIGVQGLRGAKEFMVRVQEDHPNVDSFETSHGNATLMSNENGVQIYRVLIDEEGTHTPPELRVVDRAGNETVYQVSGEDFVIDNEGPSINITQMGPTIGRNEVSFLITLNDDNLGASASAGNSADLVSLNSDAFTFRFNGVNASHTHAQIVATTTQEGRWDPVTNPLVVTAVDLFGNETTQVVPLTLVVDSTAPTVEVETTWTRGDNADNKAYHRGPLTFDVRITDEGAGLRSRTTRVRTASGDIITPTVVREQRLSHEVSLFTYSIDLEDTFDAIIVEATDYLPGASPNRVEHIEDVFFTINNEQPEVAVSVGDSLMGVPGALDVTLTTELFTQGGIEVLNVPGAEITDFMQDTVNPYIFRGQVLLHEEGIHDPVVSFTNRAGTKAEYVVPTVTVDDTAPVINVLTDLGDGYTEAVVVDFYVDDLSLDINSVTSDIGFITFERQEGTRSYFTLTVSNGVFTGFTLTATDGRNLTTEYRVDHNFVVNSDAPVIVPGFQGGFRAYRNEAVYIDVRVQDKTLPEVTASSGSWTGDWESVPGELNTYINTLKVSGEGTHTISLNAVGISGLETDLELQAFTIDLTTPEIVLTEEVLPGYHNTTQFLRGIVYDTHLDAGTIGVTGATALEVVELSEGRVEFIAKFEDEGLFSPIVTAEDLAGNIYTLEAGQFTLDKTAPGVTTRITSAIINDVFSAGDVVVELTVTDSNFDMENFQAPEGALVGAWETSSGIYKTTLTFSEEGLHEGLTLEVMDKAGNEASHTLAPFVVDLTAPELNITPNFEAENGSFINGDAEFTIEVKDTNFNPIATTTNGQLGAWQQEGDVWTATAVLTGEGVTTLTFTVEDMAGNQSDAETDEFIIDTVAPVVSVTTEDNLSFGKYSNKLRTFNIEVIDLNFDPSGFEVAYGILGEWESAGDTHKTTLVVDSEGTHNIQVVATDLAGNVASYDLDEFVIDKTAPVITLGDDEGRYFAGNRVVDIVVEDASFRPDLVSVNIGKLSDWTSEGDVHTAKVTITEDGIHNLEVNALDAAGNIAEAGVLPEFVIDTIAPVLKVSSDDTLRNMNFSNEKRTFILEVTETNFDSDSFDLQGVDGTLSSWASDGDVHTATLQIDTEGTHTGVVLALGDHAGNKSTYTFDTFIIDKVAPEVEITPTQELKNGNFINRAMTYDVRVTEEHLLQGDIVLSVGQHSGWEQEGSIWKTTVTVEEEGTHTLEVKVIDKAGNVRIESAEPVTIAKTAPVMNISSTDVVLNGHYSNFERTFTLEVVGLDLDITSLEVSEGVDVGTWVEHNETRNTVDLVVSSEGVHNDITVSIADKAGNTTDYILEMFVIDKTVPEVSIEALSTLINGNYIADVMEYEITVTDTNLALNDIITNVGKIGDWTTEGTTHTARVTVDIDGPHRLEVTALDKAGNVAVASHDEVIISRIAPTISATSNDVLTNGHFTNSTRTFELEVVGEHFDKTTLIAPEGSILSDWTTQGNTHRATLTFEDAGIFAQVMLSVADYAGNTSTHTLETFIIDHIAPQITVVPIHPVLNGEFVNHAMEYEVIIVEENLLPRDITANIGEFGDWVQEGNTHRARIVVSEEGPHELVINAVDLAGNEATPYTASRVTVDKTAPIFEVSSRDILTNGNFSNQARTFDIRVSEENFDASSFISPEGSILSDWENVGGTYYNTLTINTSGVHSGLSFSIADLAGNKTSYTLEDFMIDKEAPEITIEKVTPLLNGNFINDSMIYELTIVDDNLNTEDVYVNIGTLGTWTSEGNKHTAQVSVESEGTHTLTVTAVDKAANIRVESSEEIVIDLTAPELKIISEDVLMNGNFSNDSRTFRLEVTEEHFDMSSIVIPEGAELSDWTLEGNKHVAIATFTFEGVYVDASFTVGDKAGNISSYMLDEFVIDKTAPEIKVTPIETFTNGNFINRDMTYEVTIVDSHINLADVSITTGTVGTWVTDGNTHTTQVIITEEGAHTLKVDAVDLAGNVATQAVADEFILVRTVPKVSVTSQDNVLNGIFSNETRTFDITVVSEHFDDTSVLIPEGASLSGWTTEGTTHSAILLFEDEGTYEGITFTLADKAANTSSYTLDNFVIDQTVPVIEVEPLRDFTNGNFINEDMVYEVRIAEEHLNTGDVTVSVGQLGDWTRDGAVWTTEVTITSQGTHQLTVEAVDMAGNKAVPVEMDEFILDRSIPGVEVTSDDILTNGIFSNFIRTFNIEVTADHFDIDTFKVPEGGTLSEWTFDGTSYHATLAFKDAGRYEGVTFSLASKAGTVATQMLDTFVIDFTAPEISIKSLDPFVNDNFINRPQRFEVSIDEAHLNPNDVTFSTGTVGVWERIDSTWTTTVTVSEEGPQQLVVDAVDKAGNAADTVESIEFIIDTTTPAIKVSSDDVLINGRYSNTARTFNIAVTDRNFDTETFKVPEGAVLGNWTQLGETYVTTLRFPDAGVYEDVTFSLEDKAGNKSSHTLDTFVINFTAPVINVTPLESFTNGNFINRPMVYEIAVTSDHMDPRDVTVTTGIIGSWQQSGDVWTANVTISEEGTHNLTVNATDRAGNKAAPVTMGEFIIDKTALNVRVTSKDTLTNDIFSNTTRTFDIEVTGTNFDELSVAIPKNATLSTWVTEGNTSRASLVFEEEGTYKGETFILGDKAGNMTQYTLEDFIIDHTAASIEINRLSEVTNVHFINHSMVYEVRVTDPHLNPNDVSFNLGTHSEWVQDGSNWTTRVTIENEGEHTLIVDVLDKAANHSQETSTTFILDTTAPIVTVTSEDTLRNDLFSNSSRTFEIEVVDEHFDASTFTVPSGARLSDWTVRGTTHRASMTFDNAGVYNDVIFSLADKAGNSTSYTLDKFIIDMTAPEIQVSQVHTFRNGHFINHEMVYEVRIIDNHLDPADVSFNAGRISNWVQEGNEWTTRVTISDPGTHSLVIDAVDKAGNIAETARMSEFIIDKTAPVVRVTSNDTLTHGIFSNRARTFNIEVTDAHFDRGTFQVPSGATLSNWTNEGTTHRATLTFSEPGTYTGVTFSLADKAGNATQHTLDTFVIDKTAPVINITPQQAFTNGRYINQAMTYLVTITDAHLDPADVGINIGTITGWTQSGNTWTTRVTIATEGTHQLAVTARDKANNEAAPVTMQEFILDTTAPEVTLTSADRAVNGHYYNENRMFVVTVNDANFDPSGFTTTLGTVGNWTRLGNVWTTTIAVTGDGEHSFTVQATDLGGNASPLVDSGTFVIDTIAPELTFQNVIAGQVFNNELQPTAHYSDTNLDESRTTVSLTTPEGSQATLEGETGTRFVTNLVRERSTDGFYSLDATIIDMAGNETVGTMNFAVNRFGSIFSGNAFDLNGQFVQEVPHDLVIEELSLVPIVDRELQVYLNGALIDLTHAVTIEETSFGDYFKYIYTIDRTEFVEGSYSLVLITTDDSGNTSDTRLLELSFVVDQTPPSVTFNVEEGSLHNMPSKEVVAFIEDLHPIDEVAIYVNDVLVETEVSGNMHTFSVSGESEAQTIRVQAIDRAGNETVEEISLYVTTNFWLNFRHSIFFIPSIIAAILTPLFAMLFLIFKRRKEKEDARNADGSTTELSTGTRSNLED